MNRIAAIRKHRKMTQTDLARSIGTSRHVILNIERGRTRIDLERAAQIAAALRCRIDQLRADG